MGSRLRPRRRRRLAGAASGLFLAVSLAGCVSVPTGGPVLSYTITQGQGGQNQPNPQTIAQPPRANWGPEEIVQGFLTASASFGTRQQIARQYLTASENRAWSPGPNAKVFRNGPDVAAVEYAGPKKTTATVTISGSVQATLSGYGGYAVPSASSAGGAAPTPPTFSFTLQRVAGQWRISQAPNFLLLTSYQFKYDYQLRNLYFFDPDLSALVPDPVYVPLQATAASLMNGLVYDLINLNRRGDWLTRGGATRTAFPEGTKTIGDVTLNGGTAAVNLGGAITKIATNTTRMQQVSAQLLWTLTGSGVSGPAVQSVELSVNGKPWSPPGSDLNPVQQLRQSNKYRPPTGASSTYYYLDGAGNLQSSTGLQGKPQKHGHIGTGYSQIAVSPDKEYVAAISNGTLFVGRIGHPLAKREGTGYTSISWDSADNLWATMDGQIVMLHGAASPSGPLGKPTPVNVVDSDGVTPDAEPFSALRVAPDGVRIAIIVGATDLHFGAILQQAGERPTQLNVEIVLSPFSVSSPGATFTAVTWWGPNNVITLRDPGPELTEYPVDGGNSTSIPAQPRTSWITASYGNPLLAGLPRGAMWADASLSGSWIPARTAISPVYPG
jgi:lipoprotein LpqB-like beta-propeller protein/sporulation and spore germination protein